WDQVLNDPGDHGHALRLLGSADLTAWGCRERSEFGEDRDRAAAAVLAYARQENAFVDMLNRRVRDVLSDWSERGLRAAVYGAGFHTLALSSHVDIQGACSWILDGDPKKQGTVFMGLPVHAPEEIPGLGIQGVLVSSQRFQEEIVRRIRSIAGSDVEIAVCYDDPRNTFLAGPWCGMFNEA
ncbi:MAG: hypothetical protein HQL36_10450, partial [Alphaproteobacteria bacterium]|nr:hypothetical protein [Alphaproteobacteria bacterium]